MVFLEAFFSVDFWEKIKLTYVLHLSQFVYSFSLWAQIHCIWPNPVCGLSTLTDEVEPLGYLWSSNNVPFVLNEPPENWWNDICGQFLCSKFETAEEKLSLNRNVPAWRSPEPKPFWYWCSNLSTRNLYSFASNWIDPWFVTVVGVRCRLASMIDNSRNSHNTSSCLHYLCDSNKKLRMYQLIRCGLIFKPAIWLGISRQDRMPKEKWMQVFTYSVWMRDKRWVKLNDRHQCEQSAFLLHRLAFSHRSVVRSTAEL